MSGPSNPYQTRRLEILSTHKVSKQLCLQHKVFARAQLADPNANTTTWYTEPDDQGNECPEPKVNIYGQDGFFKEHTDGMQLTILVVLNEGYTGGGTAFFAEAPYQMWMDRSEQADRVSIPRAGTGTYDFVLYLY